MESLLRRLGDWLQNLVDQLLMIFDLATLDDSIETRFKRLRHIYYPDPKVNRHYRRVRDVLRGHVAEPYRDYYERMLSAERAAYQASQGMPSGAGAADLLAQMQRLSEKAARLIEEAQHADQVLKLYDPTSSEAEGVEQAHTWLLERIEEALTLQAGIPAQLMRFKTTQAGRGVDKLSEAIARLTTRLDDIADSYADIDAYTAAHRRDE